MVCVGVVMAARREGQRQPRSSVLGADLLSCPESSAHMVFVELCQTVSGPVLVLGSS